MTGPTVSVGTTAELLEQMTDRGKFEKLASAILRRSDARLRSILETGTNAQGESVKSPSDCFCQVPETNPPLFVLVHHTTTDSKGLRGKWLRDQPRATFAGDVQKALDRATEIRSRFAHARFLVVLTTNQRVSEDLATDVYEAAAGNSVSAEIYSQSRLTDCLDNTPDGQWLRQQYLGITAERLSSPLLMSICRQNLGQYEEFLNTRTKVLVDRDLEEGALAAALSGSAQLVLLVGASGSGKSALAYRLMSRLIRDGEPALWLDADMLAETVTLPALVDAALRAYHPQLTSTAGADAMRLRAEGRPLILVVDDINRSREPDKLLRRLLAVSAPGEATANNGASSLRAAVLLCPLWTDVWARMDRETNMRAGISLVGVGRMQEADGEIAVLSLATSAGVSITGEQARRLASKMAFEPIQLGLFGRLLSDNPQANLEALADNTLEFYMKMTLDRLSRASTRAYLVGEYEGTVARLGSRMLQERNLRPTWSNVEQWLTPSSPDTERMREIVHDGELCRVPDSRELLFRHDRVLETVVVAGAKLLLSQAATDAEAVYDPYYTDILGRVLAGPDTETGSITAVCERNPAALFSALRRLPDPPTDRQREIVTQVVGWARAHSRGRGTLSAIVDSACWSLMDVATPVVFEVTDAFPRYLPIMLARLRNGSADDGAVYCMRHGVGLNAFVTDHARDAAIEHARFHHFDDVVTRLGQMLNDSTLEEPTREGALCLAGFFADPRLETAIARCWETTQEKAGVLPAAIWAAVRCAGSAGERAIGPILEWWRGLSDERDKYGMSPRSEISHELRFALRRGVSETGLQCLVREARSGDDSWQAMLYFLIGEIDHPHALESFVRYLADRKRVSGGQFWMLTYGDAWSQTHPGGRRMSAASREHLWRLAHSPAEDRYVRDEALATWLMAARDEDLPQLRQVSDGSWNYLVSLRRRVSAGDPEVVPDLVHAAAENPWLLPGAYRVWCPALRDAVDSILKSLHPRTSEGDANVTDDMAHEVSRLLMRIPRRDAEQLFTENWVHIGHINHFIVAALYVGTPECSRLAADAIAKAPSGSNPLKYVAMRFGVMMTPDQDFLEIRHFDALHPYLKSLEKSDLGLLAEGCERLGFASWGHEHVMPLLDEDNRKRYYPTDDDLLQQLDELLEDGKHGVSRVKYWLKSFDARHDPSGRASRVLDEWLAGKKSLDALEVAAAALRYIGKRSNLSLLDKYAIAGPPDDVTRTKENARFAVCLRSLD